MVGGLLERAAFVNISLGLGVLLGRAPAGKIWDNLNIEKNNEYN